jgi:hypothetical protein
MMRGHGARAGVRASLLASACIAMGVIVPSASASVATMMKAATGYSPAQVTTEPVCAGADPGFDSCDAEALITLGGQLVRPLGGSPRTSSATVTVGPDTTVSESGPSTYSPQFIQQAYDMSWLSATAGTGTTVAIVDAYGDPTAAADLDVFRSTDGLPAISHSACTPNTIASHSSAGPCMVETTQTGSTTGLPGPAGGWDIEESLDLDAVSSMCPNCNILFIEASGSSNTALQAGDEEALRLGVKLISNSFGALYASGNSDAWTAALDSTGDASGAELFASTGDNGAYVDEGYTDSSTPEDTQYPAAEPYVTAVGGTSISPAATARGISESAWGVNPQDGAGSGCDTFDARPAWQASAGTGCSGRAVSDLSADASPATGLNIYDTTSGGGWQLVGGTSLAAPLTAAFTAVTAANARSTADTDGLLSGQWAYADASKLNDITSGSDGNECTGSAAYNASQICNAGSGWDGPTGVGSISGSVLQSGVGPSLTVPPDNGVDNGENGYSVVSALTGSGPATTATFDGGAYPNGNATEVWWKYGSESATDNGTDFSSATSTAQASIGSGTAPALAAHAQVSVTAGTVYYVEQCASNNSGSDTVCGNVTEFTTGPGPDAKGAAELSDTGLGLGDTLSLSGQPTWSPTPTSTSYQWQQSSDGTNWADLGGASSSPTSHPIGLTDSRQYVRVAVAATDVNGTTTIYSNDVQAANFLPQASGNPTLSDTSLIAGGVLSVSTPTWSPAVTTSVAYQWQESSNNSSWSNISGATANTYTIAQRDSSQFIRAQLVATNGAGSSTYTSGSDQVGSPSASAVIANAPVLSGASSVGSTLQLSGGNYTNSGGVTVTFERCARACSTAQSGSSTSYQLQKADLGYYMVATVTVAGIDGGASAKAAASGIVGPVVSPFGGALQVNGASATIKSSTHGALLTVRRTIIKPKSKKAKTKTYALTLTRAAHLTGTLRAWVCVLSGTKIVSCTAAFNVKHSAKLKLSVSIGDRLEVIAIR